LIWGLSAFEFRLDERSAVPAVFRTPHGDPDAGFRPGRHEAAVRVDRHSPKSAPNHLNTYHLYLRPGADRIAALGGLHAFSGWPGPILTDSGGFQVFSLAATRQVDDEGVSFRSHLDGSMHRLTPEKSIALQEQLGADIIMAFDECPRPHDRRYNEEALRRTHLWAQRSLGAAKRDDQALFAIVQGGVFRD
jgi:queuine tRNA-ribosyltransferase